MLLALAVTSSVSQGTVKVYGRAIGVPVTVDCNPTGTTITWAGPGTFILPPACPVPPAGSVPADSGYVTIGSGQTLMIDASGGAVTVESQGAGIKFAGGQLTTQGTGVCPPLCDNKDHTVTFANDPTQAPAWNGLNFTVDPSDATKKGDGFLSYVSIQRAITAITIDSGATTNLSGSPYGLDVQNSGIEVSFFDGINATNTPIRVTGDGTGKFGTINNIGSHGIDVLWNTSPALTGPALNVDKVTFGSSVPFGQTTPVTGSIGNEAILANFAPAGTNHQPASITNNTIFRAGNFGLHLVGTDDLTMQNNLVVCSGTGSATPASSCTGNGLKYSAIDVNNVTWDFHNGTNGNLGYNNGIDAIAFSGNASDNVSWITPVPNTTVASGMQLGYMINGSLDMVGNNLSVQPTAAVAQPPTAASLQPIVKVKGQGISLSGGALTADKAVFTSLRDNVGFTTCPSVFAGSCPAPLPTNEWTGLSLAGANSNGTITNSSIQYATKGVQISSGAASLAGGYGLIVTDTTIGPTFSDGVSAQRTPILLSGDTFSSVGDHGVNADFSSAPAHLGGGLTVNKSAKQATTFQGSVNEAILGTGLGSQAVSITDTVINNAGGYGLQLQGADNLTLQNNNILTSGTASPKHSAIYLNGVSGDFGDGVTSHISGNTGTGNGLNAIVFHGTATTPTTWQTVGKNSPALGYLLDGSLMVDGNLSLTNDVAEILNGGITVKGGVLNASGSTFTSLREQVPNIPTCGTVFVPHPSNGCLAAAAGDWNGLSLDIGGKNMLSGGSAIRFATTGISIGDAAHPGTAVVLSMTDTNISSISGDGVNAQSAAIFVKGGTLSSIGQHGIKAEPSGVVLTGNALTIDNVTFNTMIGREAIFADSLVGQGVTVTNNHIDSAGTSGIYLQGADQLSLQKNTVVNSGKATGGPFPAIYLNGVTAAFSGAVDLAKVQIAGNTGAGNGLNALAFHGEAKGDLTWQTARASANTINPPALGYVLDDSLLVDGSLNLIAGDIVKVGKGTIKLTTGTINADKTDSSSQKVFTSLQDNSAGVVACPSSLLPTCSPTDPVAKEPAPGDWSGLVLTGSSSGAFVNTGIRYADTGIKIDSAATATSGSTVFGLVISHSTISSAKTDALNDTATPLSLTDSTLSAAGSHGLLVDLTGAAPTAALRISGTHFNGSGADAILGKALTNHPVWVADNHIANAQTFGIHLQSANTLVLRNNNISSSGGAQYSAIYLDGVTADFVRNVRGNVGGNNYMDAIVFHGSVTSDLSWITPKNQASPTHPLGYMLDGALTIDGPKTMTVKAGDVVKSLGGPITLNGGTLKASDTGSKLFTSLKDASTGSVAFSCPSIFTSACTGGRGDWGGIVLSDDGAGNLGSGSFTDATLSFTVSGITIDSGAGTTMASSGPLLTLTGTAISEASVDGINAQDTPISIGSDGATNSSIAGTGSHGIVVSFFSSVACPAHPADCLKIDGVHISNTRKDAILANGLTGLVTEITNNCIGATAAVPCVPAISATSGALTYGIRLVGADNLKLKDNHVFNSGNAGSVLYPAIYLNGVTGDFGSTIPTMPEINGNTGSGNGLNAMVFHGTDTTSMIWQTVGTSPPLLGYLLDGPLTIKGDLTATGPPGVLHDVVETLNGSITVTGNLTASGATFTSLRDQISGVTGCGTPFVPFTAGTPPCPAAAKGDWGGLNVGGTATLNGTTIKFAGNGALQVPGGASDKLDCISVHDNAGGIVLTNGGSFITNSDLFNNSGTGLYDLSNGGGTTTTATPVWWGHATGPAPGQILDPANATTIGFLTTQDPTVTSFSVKDSNTNTVTGNFGKGTITVSVSFSRKMNVGTAPQVTFSGAGGPVTTLALLTSAWSTDGKTWTATYQLDKVTTPLVSAPTSVSIALSGMTSCIQDANNAVQATPAALPFTVDYSLPTPSLTLAATNVGQTATLGVKINPQGWPTTGYFQVRASGDPYGTLVNKAINGIGSGNADETLTAVYPPAGTLTPGVTYFFEAVAQTGNGDVLAGNEESFTATDVTTNLLVTAPATAKAGVAINVNVTARDHLNNTVGDYPGTVGITSSDLGTNTVMPPSAKLTAGQGVFSVTLTTLGNQTVTATDTGDATIHGTTGTIMVNPGDPAKLAFNQAPTTTMNGADISPPVTINVEDSLGHVVTGDNATHVTVALGTNPGSATLSRKLTCGSGSLTDQAVSGVVTFDCLSIDKAGIGYTLTASSTGLTGDTSSAFTIFGPATQIAFTTGPSTTRSSTNMSPAVVVKVQDALGSTVLNDSSSVTLTLKDPSSNGGSLTGTATKNADHGVASFTDLQVDAAGSSYGLHAVDGGFTADSGTFTITGSKLAFGVQPSTTMHDANITPAVTVQVEDSLNHVVTGDNTTNVTIALANNTSAGTLSRTVSCGSGTLIQKVAAGVATFDCLSVDKAEIGYTLTATTTGLTGDTSSAFTIVGPASQIAFKAGPSDAPSSTVISPDVVVKVQDALGSTVIDDSSLVTLTLNDPDTNGGNLSGTAAVNADHGVATFNNLKVDAWGSNYSLHAVDGAFTADSSPSFPTFKITGSQLVFTQEPTDTAHGASISPAVTVAIQDSLGHTVTTDSATQVTIAIDTNPGAGTLSRAVSCGTGTLTEKASMGVATFDCLSINNAANGYKLKVSASGFADVPSTLFNITP